MLTLETAPANLPVSMEDVRHQLRIDGDDEDATLDRLLRVATAAVDGKGALGRPLITQTWAQWVQNPSKVRLLMTPLQALTSIQYWDEAGVLQTATLADYEIIGQDDNVWVRPVDGATWPDQEDRPDAIKITYRAGYGDNPEDIPENIRHAILFLVTHWFELRMPISDKAMQEIPWSVGALLDLERPRWYG